MSPRTEQHAIIVGVTPEESTKARIAMLTRATAVIANAVEALTDIAYEQADQAKDYQARRRLDIQRETLHELDKALCIHLRVLRSELPNDVQAVIPAKTPRSTEPLITNPRTNAHLAARKKEKDEG